MFVGTFTVKGRRYVRIVESVRVNGKPTHRVIANLGNVAKLRKSIPTILRGLHRLLGEADDEVDEPQAIELENIAHAEFGVTLVVNHLWQELELTRTLQRCLRAQKERNPAEILIRTMVANRLSDPRSKLGIAAWLEDATMGHEEDRFFVRYRDRPVSLADRFYKAMDSLLRHRGTIERALYGRLRHLFSLKASVVFYDLTPSYFEGTESEYGRLGYSRDEKPGNLQVVIGLVLVDGLPVGHHVFRGNRNDPPTLKVALEKIERRFQVERVVVIADRALLTEKNLRLLRNKGYEYILACRRRRSKDTRKALRARPPLPQVERRWRKPVVWSLQADDGDRLVGYTHPESRKRDRARREDILEVFRQELHDLQISLRRNRKESRDDRVRRVAELLAQRRKLGKRYFTATIDEQGHLHYRAKERVLRYEALVDGTTIIKSNNRALSDADVVERYKELARIEDAFRELKDFIDLRPIHHRKARRIAAHVFVCVLALLVEAILARRLKQAGVDVTARVALRELKRLRVLEDVVAGARIRRLSYVTSLQRRLLEAFGVQIESPLVSVRLEKRRNSRRPKQLALF